MVEEKFRSRFRLLKKKKTIMEKNNLHLIHRSLEGESDIQSMRCLMNSLPKGTSVIDFEEVIQTRSVQDATRLWFAKGQLISFAYVDDYNNLCFDLLPDRSSDDLESEIVAWGLQCMRERSQSDGEEATLDASCTGSNIERIQLLERHGFEQQAVRSLHFERALSIPIPPLKLPAGYQIRTVRGASEVADLVALHRLAFGSDRMTAEYRLAMMHAPQYEPRFDWVAQSSSGTLAAFCIGSFDEEDPSIAYLDPVGTHPDHRRLGLAGSMMGYGMTVLAERGVKLVKFGTSSENMGMQKLGEQLGFSCRSESVWFSKPVN